MLYKKTRQTRFGPCRSFLTPDLKPKLPNIHTLPPDLSSAEEHFSAGLQTVTNDSFFYEVNGTKRRKFLMENYFAVCREL